MICFLSGTGHSLKTVGLPLQHLGLALSEMRTAGLPEDTCVLRAVQVERGNITDKSLMMN